MTHLSLLPHLSCLPLSPSAQLADAMYRRIVDLAKQDAMLWRSGIDPQRGYLQITTEFLPARAEQLNRYANCILQLCCS